MALEVGMIARIKMGNNAYHSTTSRHWGVNEEMASIEYILISKIVDENNVQGLGIDITGDTYTIILREDWPTGHWNWHPYDLRPTKLATTLRRID